MYKKKWDQKFNGYIAILPGDCIYLVPNKEMVPEHAKKGGFPANSVSQVATIISPATAK